MKRISMKEAAALAQQILKDCEARRREEYEAEARRLAEPCEFHNSQGPCDWCQEPAPADPLARAFKGMQGK